MSLPTPNTRKEQYLNAIATGNSDGLPTPITREEEYLDAIAKSGGGSGDGDMKKSVYDSDLAVANAGGIGAFVSDAISGKVDKVEGKGLSTNDYDNTEKGKVADNAEAIEAMVNVNGCCNVAVHNCQSTTIGGATFTVNADSSITATAPITGAWQGVASTALFKLKGGVTYKLTSGLPATSGFFMQLRDENGVDLVNTYQVTETAYTPSSDMNCKVAFLIHDGYSMTSDETLYPMIYDARLNPSGYVPYAMTNRELTEKVKSIYKHDSLLTANGGTESINISAFDTGRPYIIMCNGKYNPLWRYMGLLCITEESNGYLFDIVTDPTLTVSVSRNTLTLRNNNYDNAQMVGVTIMG